jgi:hypothetical protein
LKLVKRQMFGRDSYTTGWYPIRLNMLKLVRLKLICIESASDPKSDTASV